MLMCVYLSQETAHTRQVRFSTFMAADGLGQCTYMIFDINCWGLARSDIESGLSFELIIQLHNICCHSAAEHFLNWSQMWHSYPRCNIGMGGCSHPPPMVRRVYTKTTISRDIAMLQILNPLRPGDTYMSENWVIVGSPYGLSQRQAINLANADLSSIWSLWINVKEITIYQFSYKKVFF